MLKKIVVTGPESSGKTTLCQHLAAHFNCDWVPEYAREYIDKLRRPYHYEDLLTIAEGQLKLEAEVIQRQTINADMIFIDTDCNLIKTWSEFLYNRCDNRILSGIASATYHGYLLCDPALPWQPDTQREYPDVKKRYKLYHHYRNDLIFNAVPWKEVTGIGEERLKKAIAAVGVLTRE